MSVNILIIGATRGLGASLVKQYAKRGGGTKVFATTRSSSPPANSDNDSDNNKNNNITWLTDIDMSHKDVGEKLISQLSPKLSSSSSSSSSPSSKLSTVIISAGYFGLETFSSPDWDKEVKMYTTSAIGPVFVVHHLVHAGLLNTITQEQDTTIPPTASKIILISSESGSLTLRHRIEGGGNYAHHASKSALNMVGKLLSLDLYSRGIAVGMIHPGFMRTEMTRGVGFDKFYEDGGAVTPDEAAQSLVEFVEDGKGGGFDMRRTGEYWAPRGARDIGTAEAVLGKDLPTPLQLPW